MDHISFLKNRFGYSNFRPGQWEIIECALKQKNVLGILATGTGKTLCYQYASELLEGLTIVISPLIALMEDQVTRLRKEGHKRVGVLHSGLSRNELHLEWILFRQKQRKILFISPERLLHPQFLKEIKHHHVSLLVVDEAHCISQWGYDFRPDYLYIRDTYEYLGHPTIMALTATASLKVQLDIIEKLNMVDVTRIVLSMNRQNIAYYVHQVQQEEEKLHFLQEQLPKLQYPGIIYTNTRKQAEMLANWLTVQLGENVFAYHAGLTDEDRILIQNQFIVGQVPLLVATSAFGMGIDKDNIRFVIHFELPGSIERYLQEVGRIGRDGENGIAILLYAHQDVEHTKAVITSSIPTELELQHIIQELQSVSYIELEKKDDYEHLPIKSIFLQLIKEGWIEEDEKTGDYYWKKQLKKKDIVKLCKQWDMHRTMKEQMINLFAAVIEKSHCIRKGLMQTLNEQDHQYMTYCCSKCGIDLSYYYHNISRNKNSGSSIVNGWIDELYQLLPIESAKRVH